MKVRKGSVYTFKACGWDRFDRRDNTPTDGTRVRVCSRTAARSRTRWATASSRLSTASSSASSRRPR